MHSTKNLRTSFPVLQKHRQATRKTKHKCKAHRIERRRLQEAGVGAGERATQVKRERSGGKLTDGRGVHILVMGAAGRARTLEIK
jgi:hypothetical protein